MADEIPDPNAAGVPDDGHDTTPDEAAAADDAAEAAMAQFLNEDGGGDDAAPASDPMADAMADAMAGDLPDASPMSLPDFGGGGCDTKLDAEMNLLGDVKLRVKIELGRTLMYLEDVLRLSENSVVELDRAAGDPVDIYVNDRHVARGEVLVVNENFCVRISDIISQPELEEAS